MQGISSKIEELQLLILAIEQGKLADCHRLAIMKGIYVFKDMHCSRRIETQVKVV